MALFGARRVDVQVTAVAWSRTVQMEQREWVSGRGSWHPGDEGRNVEKNTGSYWAMVTDTTPGAPDMSGIPGPSTSSTRSELRTRGYYTYEVQEWHKGRTLRASGADQDSVAWPDFTLAPGERVRDRKEVYSVTFASAGKRFETTLPEQEWR